MDALTAVAIRTHSGSRSWAGASAAVSPPRAIRSACLRAAIKLKRASSFPGSWTSASSNDQMAGPMAPERK